MRVVAQKPDLSERFQLNLNAAVDVAFEETARKSRIKDVEALKGCIGKGSYEHTNFRMFLAPHLVEILEGMHGVGLFRRAWVHSIDVTEADPSAADRSGDGSPCDAATGQNLSLIVLVDSKNSSQSKAAETLNKGLVQVLGERGMNVAENYLHVDYVTEEEMEAGLGAAGRFKKPYYPATELSWGKSR